MSILRRTLGALVLGVGVVSAQPAPEQPAPAPAPAPPAPEAPAPEAPAPETPSIDLAAPPITTQGRVINALGRPVRGATVTIEGVEKPVKTDRSGWFKVKAPLGASIIVEAPGYGVGLVTVTGELLEETVLLSEEQLAETIEIESEAPPPAQGAAKLDRKELQRVPGTGGDVVRALTVMPGVTNFQLPLGYSGVVIRGSSPQDSKVLIDDFEVPLLFHNIGFRAIVPSETIESLDFIPGGFDVAYGRASSGIVLMRTRPGADDTSAQAEVSVIDGGVMAQGRAGKHTRYLFAARRSTIDFVLPSVIPESVDLTLTTLPRYWDGQLRVDHELSQKWRLTFSALGTDDVLEAVGTRNEDEDAAATKRFSMNTRFARVTAAARFKDGPWTGYFALSSIITQFNLELGLHQRIKTSYPAVTPRFEITRTSPESLGLKNVEWRFGGEAQVGYPSANIAVGQEPREGEPPGPFDPEDTSNKFDGSRWIPDFAAWTAVAADLDPNIRFTAGVRAEAFAAQDETSVQPRGDLQIKLAKEWKLRFSAGAYRRPPEYQTEILSETAKSERSTQMIAGVQWEPRPGARVQASGYYTDRSMLLRNGMTGLENTGRGTSYGGELLGTYRGGPWFAWLTYTYSHSTRVDTPGAMERLFDYDQPHSLNAAVSWKKGRWQLGGRFQLYSGLPSTPVLGGVLDSDRNLYIPIYGAVNSERAPMHHQLDLRVDYSWQWGPVAATAFLDVQNVYLNDSVMAYFYSYDYMQRAAFRSLPLIPSIGLRGVL